jgi:RimJ/RimL family protein N-acetyltransferase
LLEGRLVNLKVMEKEDLPLYAEWLNNPDFYGKCDSLEQRRRIEVVKSYEDSPPEEKRFLIEKKDGTRIGVINHYKAEETLDIGFTIVPSERGKGYATEAVKIMTDYLFLSKEVVRLQARTDSRNFASQKVLENAGFMKEGLLRKAAFIRGDLRDLFIYSILREEWKEPKILTNTQPE